MLFKLESLIFNSISFSLQPSSLLLTLMAEQTANAILVLMTAGSREEAARLAEMLVASRLAACVQIMPEMESIYWWNDQVERSPEILLLAKTTQENFAELEQEVRALHSYETPEIIALPVTIASAPYLEWLNRNVRAQARQASSAGSTENIQGVDAE